MLMSGLKHLLPDSGRAYLSELRSWAIIASHSETRKLVAKGFRFPAEEDVTHTELALIDRNRKTLTYKGYFHAPEGARARQVERLRPVFEKYAGLRRTSTDFSHLEIMDARGVVIGCLQELIVGRTAYGPVKLTEDDLQRAHRALEVMAT